MGRFRQAIYGWLLFAANLYVCWRIFRLNWSHRMDSIEGAYIGISRHILASFPDLGWWPAWYGGIPFENSYPPLLHVLVALFAAVTPFQVARAHHVVTGLFYCAGPVFVYLMLRRLSGKATVSFFAALLYTAVSPCAFLARAIAADLGDPFRPRRLSTLIAYGEGPHVAALALLPLALWMLDRALERRTPWRCAAAVLAFSAVALTNWLGAFALAALVLCYLAAGRHWRDWVWSAAFGVAAYLLAAPVMPPSLIQTIQFNAKTIGGDFSTSNAVLLHYGPFALAGLLLIKVAMWRLRTPHYLQMLAMFTAFTGWISLGYSWFGVAVVPQPERYLQELDLGLTLGVVMAAALLPRRVVSIAAVLLVIFAAEQLYRGQRYARGLIYPVDIATTVEYRIAKWCDQNLRGARVMVPGTVSFFFNAFTETPQFAGGFENGVVNYVMRVSQYQILSGAGTTALNEAPLAVLWLKAFGVQAVAAGGPKTREYYHPFAHGEKFRGVLPELFREGDDAIYRVPLRNSSLAHVMSRAQLVQNRPVNGLDVAEVRRYVEAIDDPALPEAQFVWKTQHSAEILADLAPGQVVEVQETYHPGWHTSSGTIIPDGMGFFAVAPDCSGKCRIELVYDGGNEQRMARWASGLTVLCWLGWATAIITRRKARSTGSSANPRNF